MILFVDVATVCVPFDFPNTILLNPSDNLLTSLDVKSRFAVVLFPPISRPKESETVLIFKIPFPLKEVTLEVKSISFASSVISPPFTITPPLNIT